MSAHTVIIRPSLAHDLKQILALTRQAGFGMTNLPAVEDLLAEKISRSNNSFAKNVTKPSDELYFFVMEDLDTNTIVGTCGIIAQNDYDYPFYNYKITQETRISESLNITRHHHVLHLVNDYQGISEIGLLFLLPEYRKQYYGQLLSRARFLYIAENKPRFTDKIIAEFRGVINENGRSPFWQSLGHKFIDLPFTKVDSLFSHGEKKFIAELMPRAPIYSVLLSKHAQAAIGNFHVDTAPAVTLLQREGFIFNQYIGIFDGGPCFELHTAQGHTINHSKRVQISEIREPTAETIYLIATVNTEFRACLGALEVQENNLVMISKQVAQALNVKKGDPLRCIPLK